MSNYLMMQNPKTYILLNGGSICDLLKKHFINPFNYTNSDVRRIQKVTTIS